ncbi:MAG: transglutaminase-like cysteine peptidase [Alphaproteobacteria bacterium]|nr:transglutaminase-like cysteine peptidase [Alphaproteobacteria bacterium]
MKIKTAVGAALLGLVLGLSPAAALDHQDAVTAKRPTKDRATEYGKTLPPVGFVNFCARNATDCQPTGSRPVRLTMSPERWNLLYQVNTYVNGKIAPVSDQDLFGEPEYWTYPTDAGDCEDYVLLKKRYLENLGFSPSALLITVVLDEKNEGHAVLTVTTGDGDYILDNRRNEIRRWNDLDYTFLKRQSPRDPRAWVALVKEKTIANGFVAGGNRD